ncbi:glycoside hydrolase family 116 protein [Vibrio chagasii]|nr:glycoside hydrolase family 116 protein [Vibrio chagasii]
MSNLIAEGDDLPLLEVQGIPSIASLLMVSLFTGASLWVAGLQAASELAKLMGEHDLGAGYLTRSEKGINNS